MVFRHSKVRILLIKQCHIIMFSIFLLFLLSYLYYGIFSIFHVHFPSIFLWIEGYFMVRFFFNLFSDLILLLVVVIFSMFIWGCFSPYLLVTSILIFLLIFQVIYRDFIIIFFLFQLFPFYLFLECIWFSY